MANNKNTSTQPTQPKNSLSILDRMFDEHGWVRASTSNNVSSITYMNSVDAFQRFIIEHLHGSTYKVAFPLTNTQYCYATTVESVFDLMEYVEHVLKTYAKKTQ